MNTKHRVLIADDDEFVCEDIATTLDASRFDVDKAHDLETAYSLFRRHGHSIVLTDLHMGGSQIDGLLLLERVKQESERSVVMILSGYNDVPRVVTAMKLGASDYLTKPYEPDQIAFKIAKLAEKVALQDDNARMREELSAQSDIMGVSSDIENLRRKITLVAKHESPVLIMGPNGSGKELVALAIRSQSSRAGKPFVPVNCGAIPENLFEGELFGTAKGAFTGAADRKGHFESAHEGILFLDEIGEMSPANQVKLLRVIETNKVTRLGGSKEIPCNVRVLAATNRDLRKAIAEGRFREDLFYRLNCVELRTTPLHERPEDIPILVEHVLKRIGRPYKVSEIFTPEALGELLSYEWPGNVRELRNVVERLLIFWDNSPISPEQIRGNILSTHSRPDKPIPKELPLKEATRIFEVEFLLNSIRECKGNFTQAALKLGITRPYLYEKMKNLGIDWRR